MQEGLRSAYRQREPVVLESTSSWREWIRFIRQAWIPVSGMASVLVLAALISVKWRGPPVSEENIPATAHPDDPADVPDARGMVANAPVRVVGGDLHLKHAWDYRGLSGVEATTADKGGVLSWGTDVELHLHPRSGVLLAARSEASGPAAPAIRVVALNRGTLRLAQKPVERAWGPVPAKQRSWIEVVTSLGLIRAEQADFVVAARAAPFGTEITVSVATGEVQVERTTGQQVVRAGETVTLRTGEK